MIKKFIKSAIIMTALILCLNYITLNTYAKVNSTIYVKTISNINVNVKQNDVFSQPTQVTANMSDGSIRRLNVSWDKQLSTSSIGSFSSKGTVKGYKSTVLLTLNVINYISLVNNIELVFNQNDNIDFPTEVDAHMSNGKTLSVPIKWNSEEIDNKQVGVYTFVGNVAGYDKDIYLKITIKSNNKSTQEIALDKNAVVTILSIDDHNNISGFGSGFIVSKDGYVVTCYHVIDGYQDCKVVLENGKRYDVDYVSNYDKEKDIAILKLKNANDMPFLSLGNSDNIEIGEDMVAIGSPEGYQNTVSNGIISGKDRTSELRNGKDIQFTAGVTSGSSGGAIFNMKGQVIGMVYATYKTGNLSTAVPANEILPLLALSNKTSLAKLSPLTASQKFELQLQKTYSAFTNGTDNVEPSEIYVDVYSDNNDNNVVEVVLSYDNNDYDNFTQKLYKPIINNNGALKKDFETWLKKIYMDVKKQYPGMDIYGYIDGNKSFNDKPNDKDFNNVSLDKITGKWNGYVSLGSFSENEKTSKDAKVTPNEFRVTWKSSQTVSK